jgi:hypothetical protein
MAVPAKEEAITAHLHLLRLLGLPPHPHCWHRYPRALAQDVGCVGRRKQVSEGCFKPGNTKDLSSFNVDGSVANVTERLVVRIVKHFLQGFFRKTRASLLVSP